MLKRKVLMASSFLLGLSSYALAQGPTGLKPTTKEELRRMQKEHGLRRVKTVKPNALGLERANGERSRRGLPHLQNPSQMGKDTETDSSSTDFENMSATSSGTTDGFGGVLPAAVDNSLLPSFPTIGQQSFSDCAPWAMGYYQFTHNNGLALGWTNNTTDKSKKCSPKFIYNMINSGSDNGSYWSDNFSILQKHGCITWANFPEDSDYRSWDVNPDHWQAAINYRSNPVQYVNNVDTQTGLDQMKQLLNNGYVLTYGTYINSWQFTTIKSNPNAASSPLAGQKVLRYMNGTLGSHAMTVVGYDDSAWVDINNNNVVDSGELGVFKVANSWGTTWGQAGFGWVSYDALKSTSAVSGGPSSGRVAAFQNKLVYHMPVKASGGVAYTPKYLAKFSLKHAARNQISLQFGWSNGTGTTPTSTYSPFALMNKGGAYAVDGTFVMDVTDLPFITGDNKVYLTVTDNMAGSPVTLSSFDVIDVTQGKSVSSGLASPLSADNSSLKASVLDTNGTAANQIPVASISASSTSGTAPLAVSFDGSTSHDADGTIASYSWNFGDGTTASGAYVSHTYTSTGTFTASLTVTDDAGATGTTTKSIVVSSTSTTDTTKPTVSLTAPVSGSRYSRYTTVTARATAGDNVGVSKVKFYVNGYLKCTDYTAPYSCAFSMPYGTNLPVRAWAYDAAGNSASSNTSYISN